MDSDNLGYMSGFLGVLLFFVFAIVIFLIVALWKIYQKAGQPGWACIIPIYSSIILLKIAKKPDWWLVFFLLPTALSFFLPIGVTSFTEISTLTYFYGAIIAANLIVSVIAIDGLVKNFGKNSWWTLGCIFLGLIFFPILAWNKNIQYIDSNTLSNEYDPTVLDSFNN